MTLSKLSKKCSECRYKGDCEHKQMEMVGYLEPATMPHMAPVTEPILRETIDVYVPGIGKVSMYKDELEKQLHKELNINIGLRSGS